MRNKLNLFGSPTRKVDPCSFKFWFVMMVVVYVVLLAEWTVLLSLGAWGTRIDSDCYSDYYYGRHCYEYKTYGYIGPTWVRLFVILCGNFGAIIILLGWIATCIARKSLRNKYHIAPGACGCCEDCCCAYFCQPCTLCQLARHTADYRVHQAYCCNPTGLSLQAPEMV
jgi:Cys-rich protein (TIGR01571 family)